MQIIIVDDRCLIVSMNRVIHRHVFRPYIGLISVAQKNVLLHQRVHLSELDNEPLFL